MGWRHLIWIVPLSAVLLWGLVVIGGMAWHTLRGFESLGGSWEIVRIAGPFHGTGTTYRLYRKDDSGLVRVDEYVTRSYPEQWQRDAAFHQDDPYTDDLVESVERGDGPP